MAGSTVQVPSELTKACSKEMAAFAGHSKVMPGGVVSAMFEPLVKFAMNHFGGLSSVTNYEMASRFVIRIRDLLVAAALPLVAEFAAQKDTSAREFQRLIISTTSVASIAACASFLTLLFSSPLVSYLIFDEIKLDFLFIFCFY